MGKECGARFSRRLWGGSNTSPLKTTAWEANSLFDSLNSAGLFIEIIKFRLSQSVL